MDAKDIPPPHPAPSVRTKRAGKAMPPIDALFEGAFPSSFLARQAENKNVMLPFLRDVYQRSAAEANEHPFGPAQWAWENKARRDFANAVAFDTSLQADARRWAHYRPLEKVAIIQTMTKMFLSHLSDALAGEISGSDSIVKKLWLMRIERAGGHLSNVDLTPVMGPLALHHFPFDEGNENTALVPNHPDGPLKTFESALEAASYLAARIHQTRIAFFGKNFKTGDDLFLASRLFHLAEEIVPMQSEHGMFPWHVDEYQSWLDEPKHRHARSAARDVLAAYTRKSDYQLSESFDYGRAQAFYELCLDHIYWNPAYTEMVRFEKYETLLKAMPDNALLNLDDRLRSNVVDFLNGLYKRRKSVRPAIEALQERLIYTARDPKTIFIKAGKPNAQLLEDIESMHLSGIFALANSAKRYEALSKLLEIARANKNLEKQAADLALKVQRDAQNYEEIEDYEEERLLDLYDTLQQRPEFTQAREHWAAYSMPKKLETLNLVMHMQARVFGFKPADEIVTFRMSREDHKAFIRQHDHADIYPAACALYSSDLMGPPDMYPGIHMRGKTAIALNIHKDAMDDLADFTDAIITVVHEQTHQHQKQLRDMMHTGGLPEDHPYHLFATGLDTHSPWERDKKGLAFAFYRSTLTERQSFALDAKFAALMAGRVMPVERTILNEALRRPRFTAR